MPKPKGLPQQEAGLTNKLKMMVKTDSKVYFLLWKYCPQYFNSPCDTFDELKANYKCLQSEGLTETFCNNWLLESSVQKAAKYLIGLTKQLKLIELYNALYKRAVNGDVNAIKVFGEFATKYFGNDDDSKLLSMLQGASVDEGTEDIDDYEMEL